jgi:hypothetical protein
MAANTGTTSPPLSAVVILLLRRLHGYRTQEKIDYHTQGAQEHHTTQKQKEDTTQMDVSTIGIGRLQKDQEEDNSNKSTA